MSESYSPEPGQTESSALPRGYAPITKLCANRLKSLKFLSVTFYTLGTRIPGCRTFNSSVCAVARDCSGSYGEIATSRAPKAAICGRTAW